MNRDGGEDGISKAKRAAVVQNIPANDILGQLFISEMTLHYRALRLTGSLKTH